MASNQPRGRMGPAVRLSPASGVTIDAKELNMTTKVRLTALTGIAALFMAGPVLALDSGSGKGWGQKGSMKHHGARTMERVDTDSDGKISADEFSEIGTGNLIKADTDGNGELSVDEIQTAMEARRKQRMERMFLRRFDVDGDGKITVEELKDRQDKRFALLDADNDGSLTSDEFRKANREFGRMHHRGSHGKRGGWMGHHGDNDD